MQIQPGTQQADVAVDVRSPYTREWEEHVSARVDLSYQLDRLAARLEGVLDVPPSQPSMVEHDREALSSAPLVRAVAAETGELLLMVTRLRGLINRLVIGSENDEPF